MKMKIAAALAVLLAFASLGPVSAQDDGNDDVKTSECSPARVVGNATLGDAPLPPDNDTDDNETGNETDNDTADLPVNRTEVPIVSFSADTTRQDGTNASITHRIGEATPALQRMLDDDELVEQVNVTLFAEADDDDDADDDDEEDEADETALNDTSFLFENATLERISYHADACGSLAEVTFSYEDLNISLVPAEADDDS